MVRNRSLKIAKIDQHDGIAAGFGIAAAILEIVSKSQKQARYGTEKNVSQMCGTKMNAHLVRFGLGHASGRLHAGRVRDDGPYSTRHGDGLWY